MDVNLGGGRSVTVKSLTWGVTVFHPIESKIDLAFLEELITTAIEKNIDHPDADYGVVEAMLAAGYVIMRRTEKEEVAPK